MAPTRFPPGVATALGVYVYLLVDPRTGRPFYVGRGKGDRCYRHLEVARGTDADVQGRFGSLGRIRRAESTGRRVRIEVLRYGLSPAEARLVEATTADVLGIGQGSELGSQRASAEAVAAALAKPIRIKRAHRTVLLRVGPQGTDTSYESVRHGWRISSRWTDPSSPRSPQWTMVVAGDLVAGVYQIESWEPVDETGDGGMVRWSWSGRPDPDLEARYVGRSAAPYLVGSRAGSVTYVWCGPHWVNTAR